MTEQVDFPEVTPERVSQALTDTNVVNEIDPNNVVLTGFINGSVSFEATDGMLHGFAFWRGEATSEEDAGHLTGLINMLNANAPAGIYALFKNENNWVVQYRHSFLTGAGATDEQLGAMLHSFLQIAFIGFEDIETQLPHLVTWTDEINELKEGE